MANNLFLNTSEKRVSFMKNKILLLFAILTVCLYSVFTNYQNKSGLAQVKSEKTSTYKKTSTYFDKAAEQNNNLKYSLQWTFSGRTQRGWFLYVPLIQHTLKTEAEPQTPEFAEKIYEWQTKNSLKADGLLEQETLLSFIKYWQSKRFRPIILAEENQLLTAPISYFYDPTRDFELLKVEKETFAAYKKMIDAAIADKDLDLKKDENGNLSGEEKFLKLISTYRSPAYQAALLKSQPNASRAQLAFISPHFTGRALDIYVGGEPVITKDFNRLIQVNTPIYKWLVKNAERFGFYPYFYEPWHWEYVGRIEIDRRRIQ